MIYKELSDVLKEVPHTNCSKKDTLLTRLSVNTTALLLAVKAAINGSYTDAMDIWNSIRDNQVGLDIYDYFLEDPYALMTAYVYMKCKDNKQCSINKASTPTRKLLVIRCGNTIIGNGVTKEKVTVHREKVSNTRELLEYTNSLTMDLSEFIDGSEKSDVPLPSTKRELYLYYGPDKIDNKDEFLTYMDYVLDPNTNFITEAIYNPSKMLSFFEPDTLDLPIFLASVYRMRLTRAYNQIFTEYPLN